MKRGKRILRRRGGRVGAVTVETAIVLPILFLFIFASIEFSRAFVILHTAENAAYEGARVGIVPGATAQEVTDMAQSVLDAVLVNNSTIVVTPTTITNNTTDVTVTVTVPMNSNGYIAPIFLSNKVISETITLKREEFEQTVVP